MIYLTQTSSNNCGDVALRHLLMLAYHCDKYLLIKQILPTNASMYDIKVAAQKYGLTLSGYRINDGKLLRELKFPCIALIAIGDKKHYIVISKYIFGRYKVFNGVSSPISVTTDDPLFIHPFEVLIIDSVSRHRTMSNGLFNASSRHRFTNIIVHLLSACTLISGLYLINVQSQFEWPLSLFVLSAVLYLIEQSIIDRRMKSFDSQAQNHLDKVRTRQDLFDLFVLKTHMIKRPLEIINYVLISALASALLLIDRIEQILPIAFVIILTIAYCYLDKRLTSRSIDLLNETELSFFNDDNDRKYLFNNINRLSYRISRQKIVFRVLHVFLIGACSLLTSALLGTVYLNFFLFEFGSLYLIGSQIHSLIDGIQQKGQYYQLLYRFFIA